MHARPGTDTCAGVVFVGLVAGMASREAMEAVNKPLLAFGDRRPL